MLHPICMPVISRRTGPGLISLTTEIPHHQWEWMRPKAEPIRPDGVLIVLAHKVKCRITASFKVFKEPWVRPVPPLRQDALILVGPALSACFAMSTTSPMCISHSRPKRRRRPLPEPRRAVRRQSLQSGASCPMNLAEGPHILMVQLVGAGVD